MPKNQKLSQWHDGSVKPVHVGVYEVYCDCCCSKLYSRYNGQFFCESKVNVEFASRSTLKDYELILKKWRVIVK